MSSASRTTIGRVMLAALAAALGCASLADTARAAFPGENGRLAFHSSMRTGNSDIFTVAPTGGTPLNVTAHAARDADPQWSADGQRLAFSSNRTNDDEIYVREASGTLTQLTATPGADREPAFSPDGTKIAFVTTRAGFEEIYVMRADGTDQTRLVEGASGLSRRSPVWSPDGRRIAFTATTFGDAALEVVNADGTGRTQLVRKSTTGLWPAGPDWSPDGRHIVFWTTSLGSSGGDLYVVGAEGSPLTPLSTDAAFERWPVWSPDGTEIVFSAPTGSESLTYSDLYAVSPDGSGRRRITSDFGGDDLASWQPTAVSAPLIEIDGPGHGSRTRDTTPTVHGHAGVQPGDLPTVTLRVYAGSATGGTPLQSPTTTSDATTGAFSIDLAELSEGTYTLVAEQEDDAGNVGFSTARTFSVDLTAPAVSISEPAAGATTTDASPWVRGIAGTATGDLATVRVQVYAGSPASGPALQTKTLERDAATGAFSVALDALPNGTYTLVARQDDTAGNAAASPEQALHVDAAPVTGRIAFHSWYRESNDDIFAVDLDGSGLRNLTANTASDIDPAWSPDGRRLAFASDRSGDYEIWVREPDGTTTRLTDAPGADSAPAFSPDGTKIAFETWRSGASEIWVMDSDGTGEALLVSGVGGQSRQDPAWSPDGTRIAYSANEGRGNVLYVIGADGSGRTALVQPFAFGVGAVSPDWSPDGTKIVFRTTGSSSTISGSGEVWTVGADGSDLQQITSGSLFDRDPIWTGDARLVLAGASRSSITFSDIQLMDPDGTGRTSVTSGNNGDDQPALQPAAGAPLVTITRPRDGSDTNDTTPRVEGAAGTAPGDAPSVSVQVRAGSGLGGQLLQEHAVGRDVTTGTFGLDLDTLSEGTYTVIASQVDADGESGHVSSTFRVDVTAPSPAVAVPAADAVTEDSSPEISGTAGTAAGDAPRVRALVYAGDDVAAPPVQDHQVSRDAATGAFGRSAEVLATGRYTIVVEQRDAAGNIGRSTPRSFRVEAPPASGRLAFHRASDNEIYTARVDGSDLTRLTDDPGTAHDPAWSRDGRLAFASNRSGDDDIWVREPDGTTTRLTDAPGADSAPAFSPDGTKIAFETWRSGASEIWVMNADGTDEALLVPGVRGQSRQDPAWSPDGTRIAYSANEGGGNVLYVIAADGTDRTALVQPFASGVGPVSADWSPDGTRIVFRTTGWDPTTPGAGEIWTVRADGSDLRQITSGSPFELDPIYSPDGRQIAFRAMTDSTWTDLWIMDADGSGRTRITTGSHGDAQPAWQPPGDAPVVTVNMPATVAEATPLIEGEAGTAPGDAAEVDVRVHGGSRRSDPVVFSATASRSATDGSFAVRTSPLADGTYTVVAEQHDDAGNASLSTPVTFDIDTTPPDGDGDGVADADDNCPGSPNPDQADTDGDGSGDACDARDDRDGDGDGVVNADDNCPATANPGQSDNDGDAEGDACDLDDDNDNVPDDQDAYPTDPDESADGDGDGVGDNADNCPAAANAGQADQDGDGQGDACDTDRDGDDVLDENDNCPTTANADQVDQDGDTHGDACDPDRDGDDVLDESDNCPDAANAGQADQDADAEGDACDADRDGDAVANTQDNCPDAANADQADQDGDTLGDACDADRDGDSISDASDNCPIVDNADQADRDADGQGDACDADIDGDSVSNGADNCPEAANVDQADWDKDGTGDACDADRVAAQQLVALIATVEAMEINHGMENSLTKKLEGTLEAYNADDARRACAKLDSFAIEVRAQSDKKLSAADAERLLADAARIDQSIGC